MSTDTVMRRYEGWLTGAFPNQNLPYILESARVILSDQVELRRDLIQAAVDFPEDRDLSILAGEYSYLERIIEHLEDFMKTPDFQAEYPSHYWLAGNNGGT